MIHNFFAKVTFFFELQRKTKKKFISHEQKGWNIAHPTLSLHPYLHPYKQL